MHFSRNFYQECPNATMELPEIYKKQTNTKNKHFVKCPQLAPGQVFTIIPSGLKLYQQNFYLTVHLIIESRLVL